MSREVGLMLEADVSLLFRAPTSTLLKFKLFWVFRRPVNWVGHKFQEFERWIYLIPGLFSHIILLFRSPPNWLRHNTGFKNLNGVFLAPLSTLLTFRLFHIISVFQSSVKLVWFLPLMCYCNFVHLPQLFLNLSYFQHSEILSIDLDVSIKHLEGGFPFI